MHTLRRAAATTAALGTLATGAVALAPAASAASCGTPYVMTVDNPGYSGPWPDNWTLRSTMCSYRSGGYIYSYARLSWDDPGTSAEKWRTFDSAVFRVALKKHDPWGPDPVRYRRDFGIESRMESGDGSYTTPAIRHRISRWALGDGAWKLGWDNDGKGWITYKVRASPRV